jgi:N-acetylneuraminic acid mutarotase
MPSSFTTFVAAGVVAIAIAGGSQTPKVVMLPALPDARGFAGAFAGVASGHLLAGGGANFPDGVMPWNGGTKVWHDRVFALDLRGDNAAWHQVGRLPAPNGYGVSLTIAEGVLIVGGGDASRHFVDVWLMTFDDGQLRFRAMPPLPQPLAQMAGAAIGRHVHIAGGIDKPDATEAASRHWMIDLDRLGAGWKAMPPLPAAGRILAASAGVGGAFYLAGGCSLAADPSGHAARTYLRDVWRFSNGRWTRQADLPRPLAAAGSPLPSDGRGFLIVSGDDGTQSGLAVPERHKGFAREILRYDAARNIWHDAGRLDVPPPVTLPIVPWRDGFIFVNGEVRPGVRTAQVFFLTLR